MTGKNHYAEAESDITQANDCDSTDPLANFFIARAQVHATLALVEAASQPTVITVSGDAHADDVARQTAASLRLYNPGARAEDPR